MNEQLDELHILASLLGEPAEDSRDIIAELAPSLTWLSQTALDEIAQLPLEEWQAEHTRLFVSGHPSTPCLPFESVWQEGRMMGESTTQIHLLYQRIHFKPEADLPEDFLGSELIFLAEALTHYRDDEEFLMEILQHLHAWVPKWTKAVRIHSQLAYYQDYAKRLEKLFEL